MPEKKRPGSKSGVVTVDGVSMREIVRKSPIPFYGAGAAWLLYAFLFPMYRWFDFLIIAVVSVGVYFLLNAVFHGKTEMVLVEEPPVVTGDSTADQLLREGRETLRKLRQLGVEITQVELSGKVKRMTEVAERILGFVGENPAKASTVRQFLNYYLPTMLDLLGSYVKMDRLNVDGKNIDSTMLEIERVMDTVVPAFEKQLDALYQDEAMDASVDIEVLRTMLAQGGLAESDFESKR